MHLKRSLLIVMVIILLFSTIHVPIVSYGYDSVSEEKLIVVLPYNKPTDPVKANNTINTIIYLNKLNYENKIKLYMFLGNYTIEGKNVFAGSLLVVGAPNVLSKIEKELSSYGITVFKPVHELYMPLYYLQPPKIAILDVGDTYTMHDVLKSMGFNYTIISATEIANGALEKQNYDILILPPGSGTREASLLGKNGAIKVAEFLVKGGGLIGVCAGAYAVIKGYNDPTSQLQLVDATLKNWPNWWLGTGIVHLKVSDPENPVMYGFIDGFDAIYWNGPVLIPYDLENNTVLGIDAPPYKELAKFISTSHKPGAFSYGWGDFNQSYVDSVLANGSAIIQSYYGKGKIILFSVHPELLSGDLDYAPAAKLNTNYNWRLWFNAIYYASPTTKLTTLHPIHGTWMWPSTFKYIFLDIYHNYNISLDEAIRIGAELLAQELESHGITDLFIEVKSTRGYAFFPGSKYLPPYPAWPYNTINMYPALIDAMHKHHIRVHAWIPVFYDREVWGPKDPVYHVGKSVSNWKPFPVTKYVRPGNTTYIELLANFTKELLDMGFDGIHLDYIRYGHMVYSFAPADIKRAQERGINVSKVIDAIRRTFYKNYPKGYDPTYIWRLYLNGDKDIRAWFEMRREDIIRAITVIAKAALGHGTKSGEKPILSAALMPDITIDGRINNITVPGRVFQLLHYGQMWEDFAERGYWLIPMAYFVSYGQDITWVKKVSEYASRIASRYGVITAIGIQAWSVDLKTIEYEKGLSFEGGASGYVYFRWYTYRATFRNEYDKLWNSARKELYQLMPKVLSLAPLLSHLNATDLLYTMYALDIINLGDLYPEPNIFMEKTITIINNYLDSIANRLSYLAKKNITNKELEKIITILLNRARTTQDPEVKLQYILSVKDMLYNTLVISTTTIINEKVNNLLKEVEQIKEQEQNYATVNEVEKIQENLKSLEKKLGSLTNLVNELEKQTILQSRTIDNLTSRLNKLEEKISINTNSLKGLENNYDNLSNELQNNIQKVEKIKDNVSNNTILATIGTIIAVLSLIIGIYAIIKSRPKP